MHTPHSSAGSSGVSSGSAVVAATDLTRVYHTRGGDVAGVRGASFRIQAGQVVLLKGASGSGKSTLLSLLAGLDTPTGGELSVAGCDLRRASQADLTYFRRRTVGMVFQSFNLMPTMTVLENVCLPALLAGDALSDVRPRAMAHLEWLGLSHRATHLPEELSGGEMQRTAIARALINDPPVILADEPTGNLDSVSGQAVADYLAELGRRFGRTVLIATHGALADHLADRTLCIKDGQVSEGECGLS
ncbi:ABC transporter ATP-binding protein [Fundidesulfovibrio putealis]|uniref:ABC transporter ATP-binding protein n=1 Tax=Fundidesulfovibrio putealis TaxID=270496 RepID=UPI0006844EBE|nr:ABC transporter ATP-binding protein [Fundidesulfovibrio putealis]